MAELALSPPAVDLHAQIAGEKRPRWSVWCIASVLCGLLLVLPFISAIAAICFAILGFRELNRCGNVRGRRFALAGFSLGLLNIVGWTIYFAIVARISAPGRVIAAKFFRDLTSQNSSQVAAKDCLAGVDEKRIAAAASQISRWGGITGVTVLSVDNWTLNGVTVGQVVGTLQTPGAAHPFQLRTMSAPAGNWLVDNFDIR